MKLALLQLAPMGPITAPPDALRQQLRALAAAGVDLAVLPELLLPGYNQPQAHGDLLANALAAMAALAQEAGLAIAFGWAEREGDAVYNAATLVDRAGRTALHYRKLQLFGPMERASFAPGTAAPTVCTLGGIRIGLLICYDIEFPEHARAVARQGCDLLLVPTANPAGFEHVQRLLVPSRAYENRLTVAYANYAGPDGDITFGGGSVIAGPDGGVLAAAGPAPATLVVDLPRIGTYDAALLSTQLADLNLPDGGT